MVSKRHDRGVFHIKSHGGTPEVVRPGVPDTRGIRGALIPLHSLSDIVAWNEDKTLALSRGGQTLMRIFASTPTRDATGYSCESSVTIL